MYIVKESLIDGWCIVSAARPNRVIDVFQEREDAVTQAEHLNEIRLLLAGEVAQEELST